MAVAKGKLVNRGMLFSGPKSRRLRAELVLTGRSISITADGQTRRYSVDAVDILRYDGNVFELLLGEHSLFYESEFPLRLTFDFLPALEAAKRRRARRQRPASRRTPAHRQTTRSIEAGVVDGGFDRPEDEPWTDLALGHEQARLLEIMKGVAVPDGHQHSWTETSRGGETVQMCSECRQVLIDLSNTSVSEQTTTG